MSSPINTGCIITLHSPAVKNERQRVVPKINDIVISSTFALGRCFVTNRVRK